MIKTTRNVFIGAHVTAPTRTALYAESLKRGISASSIISAAVVAYLRKNGYNLEEELNGKKKNGR